MCDKPRSGAKAFAQAFLERLAAGGIFFRIKQSKNRKANEKPNRNAHQEKEPRTEAYKAIYRKTIVCIAIKFYNTQTKPALPKMQRTSVILHF